MGTVCLLTDAPMEDMVAMDVATMARGRLRLLLKLRLLTDTDTDFLMEAMDVLTVCLLTDAPTEDMVAMDVATTARGRLRLLTEMVMAAAMVAMGAPMEDTVATGPMAALTGMATESRQQPECTWHFGPSNGIPRNSGNP